MNSTPNPTVSTSLLPRSPKAVQGSRRSLWFLSVVIIVSAMVILPELSGGYPRNQIVSDRQTALLQDGALGLLISNEYGSRGSASLSRYPWDYLAEPYRVSNLTATGGDASESYNWRIMLYPFSASSSENELVNTDGHDVYFMFNESGRSYGVELRNGNATATFEVMCKYVRREIRMLSGTDRRDYFDAVRLMYELSTLDGGARFGANFRAAAVLTKKHLGSMTLDDCTAWHNALVFVTFHAGLTLEFERSLQSIHSHLAAPYWEYTLDDTKYGDHWTTHSPIFSDDFYGAFPLADDKTEPVISTGQLPFTALHKCPTPSDTANTSDGCAEKNAFGWLVDTQSFATSPYVTRASSLCGLPTTSRLPGCNALEYVLNASTDVATFRGLTEDFYHGSIHPLVGGAWHCHASVPAFENATATRFVEDVLLVLNTLTQSLVIRDGMYVGEHAGTMTCAHECDPLPRTDIVNCTCRLSGVWSAIHQGRFNVSFAKKIWSDLGLTDDLENPSQYNLTSADEDAVYIFVAKLVGSMPRFGPMTSTLGSPADPIFWPMHGAWERLWHYARLHAHDAAHNKASKQRAEKSWSIWDTSQDGAFTENCGFSHNATSTLPFSFDDDVSSDRNYTNQDLFEFFAPANGNLPFIFDSFDFSHCEIDGKSFMDGAPSQRELSRADTKERLSGRIKKIHRKKREMS